jgi:hypothetical protein
LKPRLSNRHSTRLLALAILGVVLPTAARADVFQDRVEPFATKYCHSCHNSKRARGELDLTRYTRDRDVAGDFRHWNNVIAFIRKGTMPPSDKLQPTIEERNAAVAAIEAILLVEARKNAGDPGVVLPRRLSTTEYDLSIRDLTGVAIRATAEFPVDPAAGEGFNNTGEALGMTPNLLNKYLGAAQFVSEHLVLMPNGIRFAPFPVTSYNERRKLTEQAIIDFYRKHEVRIGDYLEAAWRYRHRGESERGVSLDAWAAGRKLSGRYLALVAKTLDEARTGAGYLKQLGDRWEALAAPAKANEVTEGFKEFERFATFVQARVHPKEPELIQANAGNWPIRHLALRARVAANRDQFDTGVFKSKQLLAFDRLQLRKGEKPSDTTLYLRIDPAYEGAPAGVVVVRRSAFTAADRFASNNKEAGGLKQESLRAVLEREAPEIARRLEFGKHPGGGAIDADAFAVKAPAVVEIPLKPTLVAALQGRHLLVECELDANSAPDTAFHVQHAIGKRPDARFGSNVELLIRPDSPFAKDLAVSGERFCNVFPSRFYYVNESRGLAAGFHLVEGFFRDDQPLVEKVLSKTERDELDRLWRELNFVTQSIETLLRGFVWFERAERHVLTDKRFDYLQADDPQLVGDALLSKFERMYLERLGVKLADGEIKPAQPNPQFDMIHGFFQQVRAGLATYNQTLQRAEEPALGDLDRLAERAYCRPLRTEEATALRGLYQRLRKQGLGVEDSLRGTFTAVLMSPHFFYRIPTAPAGRGVFPLTDDALARRLSYFLWASVPDEELSQTARAGKLHDETVLRAQVRRMTKDPKIETFAREFFGQWLRYRDFLSSDPIPAGTFPVYDNALRQSMLEEPTRLITHLIQQDRPIDELLHSDSTVVNESLARYYGGSIEAQFRRQRAEGLKRLGLPAPVAAPNSDWYRVDGLRAIGRGGLFGMPVVLAKNSAGARTSPVKRGFWVVHHLLGQHFPPPPADVPALPKSEKESTKTIREVLAQHTTHQQCAMCHVHFDGLGLTLEGFDAIGRARTRDVAGRAIQVVGTVPGGKTAEGVAGLIDYVEGHRLQDFHRNLCRKFLGYALGRSVLLSDQPLLQEMEEKLQAEQSFSALFETVVLSPQFRRQRGRDYAAASR